MPPSAEFQQLLVRLAQLKARFLSVAPDASGQYSDEAKDFARGYRVLSHAEIEAFIRGRVDETVRLSLQMWREKRVAHRVVVSMLACWNKNWSDAASSEVPFPNKDKKDEKTRPITVDDLVNRAFKAFQNNIEKVYGLRPPDLNEFVMPLGIHVTADEFGATWLVEMENFGIQRGRVAHGGEAASQDINPDDERRRMDEVLPGLEKLDAKFNEIIG